MITPKGFYYDQSGFAAYATRRCSVVNPAWKGASPLISSIRALGVADESPPGSELNLSGVIVRFFDSASNIVNEKSPIHRV